MVQIFLILLLTGCSIKTQRAEFQDSSAESGYQVSLQEDREELSELRSEIPVERRKSNSELQNILDLMKYEYEQSPSQIRSRFDRYIRRKREKFDRQHRKQREQFSKSQRKRREAKVEELKDKREEILDIPDKKIRNDQLSEIDAQRKEFFSDLSFESNEFHSNQRDRRREFDSTLRDERRQFDDELRAYSKRYYDRQKGRRLEKRMDEKEKRLQEKRLREEQQRFNYSQGEPSGQNNGLREEFSKVPPGDGVFLGTPPVEK